MYHNVIEPYYIVTNFIRIFEFNCKRQPKRIYYHIEYHRKRRTQFFQVLYYFSNLYVYIVVPVIGCPLVYKYL